MSNKNKINKSAIIFRTLIIGMIMSLNFLSLMTSNVLNDWYWHTKVGEYIVNQKAVPHIGIFSWYAEQNNLSWTAHEWLSEVFIYLISGVNETRALVCSLIIGMLLMLVFCIYATKDIEKHPIQTIAFVSISCVASVGYIYLRPHLSSYILLAATTIVTIKSLKENSKYGMLLFPIAILWSNFHGGSSNLVYLIPIACSVVSLLNKDLYNISLSCPTGRKGALTTLIYALASIPCLSINPYGYRMILYPYSNMNDDLMTSTITEWAVPNISKPFYLTMFVFLFFIIIVLINCGKKIKAYDLTLLILGTFLFFKAARFFPYFVILSMFTFPNYMILNEWDFNKINFKIKTAFLTIMICAIGTFSFQTILSCIEDEKLVKGDGELKQETIEVIKELNGTHLYNNYNFGGQLIFNDIDVFIDGRADMYTNDKNESYKNFINSSSKGNTYVNPTMIEDVIKKYEFDTFVCYAKEALAYYLYTSPNYELVYVQELEVKKDSSFSIFEKNENTNEDEYKNNENNKGREILVFKEIKRE